MLHGAPVRSSRRVYGCRRADIAFLRFVLEACDGIGFLQTIDRFHARVALHVPPGCEHEIDEVMQGLRRVIHIKELPDPGAVPR
jgi:Domain of unknown function (DUF4911)